MDIIIRSDSVEITGYVNAVERDSQPLRDRFGQFIERIRKGAFKRAIQKNSDIHVLLNHDWSRDLGSTTRGNLELTERFKFFFTHFVEFAAYIVCSTVCGNQFDAFKAGCFIKAVDIFNANIVV